MEKGEDACESKSQPHCPGRPKEPARHESRCFLVALANLFVALLAAFDFVGGKMANCRYDLEVRFHSKTYKRIRTISFSFETSAPGVGAEELRTVLGYWRPLDASQVEHNKFWVGVPCSKTTSGFGRLVSYGQAYVVDLKFEFMDGTSHETFMNIPDGRFLRSISIELP